MPEAVICEPVRSAVGRYGGVYRDVPVTHLASTVIRGWLDRTGVPSEAVDDVILGQCYPNGEAPALGRDAALDAGLAVEVGGYQLDLRCGSGLQVIILAVMQVQTGASDLVIAGGAESMSQAEFYTDIRWGPKGEGVALHDRLARGRVTAGGKNYPVPGGMLETAENLRREYSISREEQDEFSLRSHQKAVAAQQAGYFPDEIIPVEVLGKKGAVSVVDTDEHPRADSSMEILGKLRPVMQRSDAEATVTAGNSSGQDDGASACTGTTAERSACIVITGERAEQLGLAPYGRMVTWAVAGVPPRTMGIGPVPSTAKALVRAGLKLSDMDVIELNEAFAAQVLAVLQEWGLDWRDDERFNPNGSGISLGHPVGATGGRILATMLREMRRRGSRYGLETMCIGGGQGLTAIFERA